jgi:excisionase family DNA binding protein
MNNVIRIVLQPGQRLEVTYAEPVAVEPAAMTLDQFATRYATTLRVVRRLISSGRLPAVKVGRRYTVRIEDAEKLFKSTSFRPQKPEPVAEQSDEDIKRILRKRGIRVPD